jgi:hypothetical protein
MQELRNMRQNIVISAQSISGTVIAGFTADGIAWGVAYALNHWSDRKH